VKSRVIRVSGNMLGTLLFIITLSSCEAQTSAVNNGADRVDLIETAQSTDSLDELHREPFYAKFDYHGFDFGLMNFHSDPDEIKTEIPALESFYEKYYLRDNDLYMLGDFNASEGYMDDYMTIDEGYNYTIADSITTNVAKTKSYDNIICKCDSSVNSGVFDFQQEYNFTYDEAKLVSDHFPVYFYIIID
jgi:deoxyribonuclease-1-like protein